MITICGNHEYKNISDDIWCGQDWQSTVRQRLCNATWLNHELFVVPETGLRIFGSTWNPWARGMNPGKTKGDHVDLFVFKVALPPPS